MNQHSDLLIRLHLPTVWTATAQHPKLEDDGDQIRFTMTGLTLEEDVLTFQLNLTARIPSATMRAIHDLSAAVVLSVENASKGQFAVRKLEDPFLWNDTERSQNFAPPQTVDPTSMMTAWLTYALKVEGLNPTDDDDYFFTILLLHWASNTTKLNLTTLDIEDLGHK